MEIDLVIFDLDGTIAHSRNPNATGNEHMTDAWSTLMEAYGLGEQERAITNKYLIPGANNMTPENHRKQFYETAALLKGHDPRIAIDALEGMPLTPGFGELCKYLRTQRIPHGIVTLTTSLAADIIVKRFNLDFAYANEFGISRGLFNGDGEINVLFGSKGKVVESAIERFGVDSAKTAYIGDSSNDIDPWKVVGHPFGMNNRANLDLYLEDKFTDFYKVLEAFQK